MDLSTLAAIGAIGGTLGTILGLINMWKLILDDRVRIKVGADFGWTTKAGFFSPPEIGAPTPQHPEKPIVKVSILNLSKFPIYISKVGFLASEVKGAKAIIIDPVTSDGRIFPLNLQPRETILVHSKGDGTKYNYLREFTEGRITRPFVETECGKFFQGKVRQKLI